MLLSSLHTFIYPSALSNGRKWSRPSFPLEALKWSYYIILLQFITYGAENIRPWWSLHEYSLFKCHGIVMRWFVHIFGQWIVNSRSSLNLTNHALTWCWADFELSWSNWFWPAGSHPRIGGANFIHAIFYRLMCQYNSYYIFFTLIKVTTFILIIYTLFLRV